MSNSKFTQSYTILDKQQFSENVFQFRVEAPLIAQKISAGQFFLVRAQEKGERVPFTFANWNPDEGWFEFIFLKVGKTTEVLSRLEVGDQFMDIMGPLGNPTDITPERWAVVGGGVGLAVAYPVARALCDIGAEVTVIMGARSENLLILREQFEALSLKELIITTDDGSIGEKGVVTAPLSRLYEAEQIDKTFAVGPAPMMKFSSLTAQQYNKPIIVSLNPIMLDGTGMCGCCRVDVDGITRFACVDGPDFDGTKVDWHEFGSRQMAYRAQELESLELYRRELDAREAK